MRHLVTNAVIGILFFTLCSTAAAQVPRLLSYQGVLTDTSGTPKPDGDYSFTFSLYKSASGGIALWSETKTLAVKRGLFSTMLGDNTAFPDSVTFADAYWLALTVDGQELTPRVQLGTVGYAIHALTTDTAKFALQALGVQRPLSPALSSDEIADGAVGTSKIAPGSIQSSHLSSDLIAPKADTAFIALSALTSAPTGDAGGDLAGSYPNPAIAAGAITEQKLADGAVTGTKIADHAIQRSDVALDFKAPRADTADVALMAVVQDASVGTAQLEDLAVTEAKLAANAVTGGKIADGSIQRADVAADFKSPKADTADFALASVLTGNSVTSAEIVDGSIQRADVVSSFKAPRADTADFALAGILAGNSVTSNEIVDGSIQRADVASDFKSPKSDTADFALASVLADNSVTTNKIVDGTITSADLASGLTIPVADSAGVAGSISSSANLIVASVAGDGSGLTNLNAENLGSGIVPSARISGTYSEIVNFTNTSNSFNGVFSGDGSGLSGVGVSGTAGGDLSGNYPNPSIADTAITTSKIRNGSVTDSKIVSLSASKLTGSSLPALDGSLLTNLNAAQLQGSIPEGSIPNPYSSQLNLSNTENAFVGRDLAIDDSTLYVDQRSDRVGIATRTPVSTFEAQGSFGLKVTRLSGGTTHDASDEAVFLVDASMGPVTIKLPEASSAAGRIYFFKLIALEGALTIDSFGEDLIEGSLQSLTINAVNKSAVLVCDGSGWYILSEYVEPL